MAYQGRKYGKQREDIKESLEDKLARFRRESESIQADLEKHRFFRTKSEWRHEKRRRRLQQER
jgi:hypothetical protein